MLRNNDRALANIESIPGGFNALSSMYRSVEEETIPNPSTEESNREFGERLGVFQGSSSLESTNLSPNSNPLPNPWAVPPPPPPSSSSSPFSLPFPPSSTFPSSSSSFPPRMSPHGILPSGLTDPSRGPGNHLASLIQSMSGQRTRGGVGSEGSRSPSGLATESELSSLLESLESMSSNRFGTGPIGGASSLPPLNGSRSPLPMPDWMNTPQGGIQHSLFQSLFGAGSNSPSNQTPFTPTSPPYTNPPIPTSLLPSPFPSSIHHPSLPNFPSPDNASTPSRPLVNYDSQLEELSSMGFTNSNLNLEALRAAGGRVESAIDYILNHQ